MRCPRWIGAGRSCFNPHPARRPDAILKVLYQHAGTRQVSILTRPEGRMQYLRRCLGCFGSCIRFNPHPARRPDAIRIGRLPAVVRVSILTRPEGRMQSGMAGSHCPVTALKGVSILTRPEGRMQCLYLNFLSVLREPPDTGFSICFHCPDHFPPTATIQLRTRTYKLQWLQHVVRVRPPAVP